MKNNARNRCSISHKMRAVQTFPRVVFPAATLSAFTEGFHAPESVAKVELIDVVAANPQTTGVDIHTEAEIEIVLFFALRLAGKSCRYAHRIGMLCASQGCSAVVHRPNRELIEENNIKPAGEKRNAFAQIQRVGPLRFETKIGGKCNTTSYPLQKLKRYDGSSMQGDPGRHF